MTSDTTAASWIAEGSRFERSNGQRIFYWRRGAGRTLVLFHGFPTWSLDNAALAQDLSRDFDVVTFDFLGYGASDKPRGHDFSVPESADTVEELLRHLGVTQAALVLHNYGGIVGQELLDRRRKDSLSFELDAVFLQNCGIVFEAYRPTRVQKLLSAPVLGRWIAALIRKGRVRSGLDAVRGRAKLSDHEFEQLWEGISRDDGHRLAHRHIRYNAERERHAARWESALFEYPGPLHLIWGMDDPVSGARVLELARPKLPNARITELAGVGHFPQAEAPQAVADAIRRGLAA